MMSDGSRAADSYGTAPAQALQDEIRRLSGVSLAHLAQSDRVLQRCGSLPSLAARVMLADAALGEALGKALAPRRKAKTQRRQSLEGELNFDLKKMQARR